jgi:hypothetical protein
VDAIRDAVLADGARFFPNIPPKFIEVVTLDWSSRLGKDAQGRGKSIWSYVTRRWGYEQKDWKSGTHSIQSGHFDPKAPHQWKPS